MKMWCDLPPPLGVAGVDRAALVDVDETGIFLPDTAREFGYAFVGARVNLLENYVRGTKWTMFTAVDVNGVICFWILKGLNTTSRVRIRVCVFVFVVRK
jgi:hypothetical protein